MPAPTHVVVPDVPQDREQPRAQGPAFALQVRRAEARQSGIYSGFTARDEFVWKTELDKFVQEGNRIFHRADAFGGTIGVSCDMCHPNVANTHPETYPKYQVQMQKVALLRDMINRCIQHPTKGKPLADDDPRLRAMEAYIISQRKGKIIEPGKQQGSTYSEARSRRSSLVVVSGTTGQADFRRWLL